MPFLRISLIPLLLAAMSAGCASTHQVHVRNTIDRDLRIMLLPKDIQKRRYMAVPAGAQRSLKVPRGKIRAAVMDEATQRPMFVQRIRLPWSAHSLWLVDGTRMVRIATSGKTKKKQN